MYVKRRATILVMARRTQEDSSRTRESLISVARTLFAERGFDEVSLEEVASAAHVTRGALYHHFGGKHGLFHAVCTRLLKETGENILRRANRESEPLQSLLEGSREFLRLSQNTEYRRIVLIDAPAVLGIDEWQKLDNEYTTATLREALNDLVRSRELTIPDPEAMAQALSGAMNQLALWPSSTSTGTSAAIRRGYAVIEHIVTALQKNE